MGDSAAKGATRALALSTLAFASAFSVWMMNGVLVAFLVEEHAAGLERSDMGWLIGAPVLTGALLRLPVGMLADRYGGRVVLFAVMLTGALGAALESFAGGFASFLATGLLLGVAGSSFSAGVAYVSAWYPTAKQGTALGIFGAGNFGAAVTSLLAPTLLMRLTNSGANPEGWRMLPRSYAAALAVVAFVFLLASQGRRVTATGPARTLVQRLAPLRSVRVWRFGLYYFVLFGGFVALSQWLIPYYLNLYAVSLATAGALAAAFSLPPNLTRIFGGWLSDKVGARRVMYWALLGSAAVFALLSVPRMDIMMPGQGIFSEASGEVDDVGPDFISVAGTRTALRQAPPTELHRLALLVLPTTDRWHEPVVGRGDQVVRKQMIAKGITHVFFQANIGIFVALTVLVGGLMGLGMAAVFRHIPQYFPDDVGGVGGIVGMLGGLGGFVGPVVFGLVLDRTGLWITCWMLMAALSLVSVGWMHQVIRGMLQRADPALMRRFEEPPPGATVSRLDVECRVHGLRADIAVLQRDQQSSGCRIQQLVAALDGVECKPLDPGTGA